MARVVERRCRPRLTGNPRRGRVEALPRLFGLLAASVLALSAIPAHAASVQAGVVGPGMFYSGPLGWAAGPLAGASSLGSAFLFDPVSATVFPGTAGCGSRCLRLDVLYLPSDEITDFPGQVRLSVSEPRYLPPYTTALDVVDSRVSRLSFGAPVLPQLDAWRTLPAQYGLLAYEATGTSFVGHWIPSASTGFAAFAFDAEGDGVPNRGWLSITVLFDPLGFPGGVMLNDYAFETAASDSLPASTPLPASVFSLATALAVVAAARRRRLHERS
jgi:hypothetical protein